MGMTVFEVQVTMFVRAHDADSAVGEVRTFIANNLPLVGYLEDTDTISAFGIDGVKEAGK